MALEMKRAKDGVRFEFADGEAETTVTLLPEDDQDTLVRKMKRVITLVEGEAPAMESFPYPTPRLGDPALLGRLASPAPQAAASTPPALPAHLRADWEMDAHSGPVGKGWEAMGDDLPSAPGEGA